MLGARHPIFNYPVSKNHNIARLGTDYGGWYYVPELIAEGDFVISAGLGLDASFDVEIISKHNVTVVSVDPTPKSINHFDQIKERFGKTATSKYQPGGDQDVKSYDLLAVNKKKYLHCAKALYDKRTELKFYKPTNDDFVSHSISNYLNDYNDESSYIIVDSATVCDVLQQYNIDKRRLAILKLDVEGAELAILHNIFEQELYPIQILIDYDELALPDKSGWGRVDKTHELLVRNMYVLTYHDDEAHFTYVRKNL